MLKNLLPLLLLTALALPARALEVFSTVPEWGALAREIGGDKLNVFVATNGLQDPHHVDAKPSLIARARRADLVVCTGAELEIGWLPLVLREAANARVQPGQPGYFEASRFVRMLEVPGRLDRADGDVHPDGNPHVQTDPRIYLPVGEAMANRLADLDPANASAYRAGYQSFALRWRTAMAGWEKQAAPLRGQNVVAHHKSFSYLFDWLGIKEVGTLEPKPGVEPTVAYLSQLLNQTANRPPKLVVRAAYNPGRAADWFAERAKAAEVVLPFTVGGSERAKDLFGLFDDTIDRLLKGLR